jgi:hypothetical protein
MPRRRLAVAWDETLSHDRTHSLDLEKEKSRQVARAVSVLELARPASPLHGSRSDPQPRDLRDRFDTAGLAHFHHRITLERRRVQPSYSAFSTDWGQQRGETASSSIQPSSPEP